MIVRNFFQKSGVLAFIGFGVTLAAQQQYEGRVGINTETPSATLNVKAKGNTSKVLEVNDKDSNKLLIVKSDGKVGIGTDTPKESITVEDGHMLLKKGYFMSEDKTNEGGALYLTNTIKDGNAIKTWALYNMTNTKPGVTDEYQKYLPGLHFWAYQGGGKNQGSQMIIADNGNVGIGNRYGKTAPSHKLTVDGNVKITGLAKNKGIRYVVVDDNGVLKVGDVQGNVLNKQAENGAVYKSVRTTSDSHIIIEEGDYMIKYTGSASATLGKLPSAKDDKGRELCFFSKNATISTGALGKSTIEAGESKCIISDGEEWITK